MRVANHKGRLSLVVDGRIVDVANASNGMFSDDPAIVYARWDEFREWADAQSAQAQSQPLDESLLEAPSPRPRQAFGIGLNYAAHAAEGGADIPDFPSTFSKFSSSVTGQSTLIELPSRSVDWEVELVVVIGREGHRISEADAWRHVAGLTVGQDLSERRVQFRPPSPQYNLGKSFPGFGATGPWLVTPDELENADDLAIECSLNGKTMQSSRTGDLIFNVAALINRLSYVVTLLPGDLIFTGTPSGVGAARNPKVFIAPGDELVSTIEGIGTMTLRFVEGAPHNLL